MTSFISSPTELLKIRMQLQKPLPGTPGYLGPGGMLQQLVRQEGVQGEHPGRGVGVIKFCMVQGKVLLGVHIGSGWALPGTQGYWSPWGTLQ
jgi:hypothetical protein